MLTVGMVGDTATETYCAAPVDGCHGRTLIKYWLIIILFKSASSEARHMPESHKQTMDFCK